MRKLFTILTAMLMVGAASVKAETTETFNRSNFYETYTACGYQEFDGTQIHVRLECKSKTGAAVTSNSGGGIVITNKENNLITSISFRVCDENEGAVEHLTLSYYKWDANRVGDIVTLSNFSARSVTLATTNYNYQFNIDSLSVTYVENTDPTILLTSGNGTWTDGGTLTVTFSIPYANPYLNATYYLTIGNSAGNVPDLRCHIGDALKEGLLGLSATNCDWEISADSCWMIITGATLNSVVISTTADYVNIDMIVLGAGGGSTPSGSTEQVDVIYKDKASAELDTEEITLHLPAAPEVEGFTFLKWVIVGGDLDNGIIIQATYQTNTPTAMPAVVPVPGNAAQKLVREGNIYILKGDKTYTVQGQLVK